MSAPTLRRPGFAVLLAANAISIAGTRMTAVAVPWLVLTTTGSAAKTGIAAVAELLPLVIVQALAGPFIDQRGARRVIIASQVISGGSVVLIPLLNSVGALSFPTLLAVVGLLGAARGPADAADMALLPDLARASGMSMERVSGLIGTADRIALLVAPGVAGFVIAGFGPANTLLIDAVSFVLCAGAVAALAPDGRQAVPDRPAESYRDQLRSGFRYVRQDRLICGLVAMVCTTNLLDTAYSSVLLPVWVHSSGHGPEIVGLLSSAFGITATGGAAVAAVYGDRMPRRLTYLVGFFLTGAPRFVVLATGAPIAIVVAVNVVAGMGCGFLNPILAAVWADRVPAELFGRVSAVIGSLAWAGMPLGGLLAGAAVAAAGVVPALAMGAALYFLATTLPGLLPEWKAMDKRSAETAPDSPPAPAIV